MKLGIQELLIILVIVIIIFGPSQLPKLSKTIGKSIKGFKKGMEDEKKVEEAVVEETSAEVKSEDEAE